MIASSESAVPAGRCGFSRLLEARCSELNPRRFADDRGCAFEADDKSRPDPFFSCSLAQKRGLTPYRMCKPAFKSQWGRGLSPFLGKAVSCRAVRWE